MTYMSYVPRARPRAADTLDRIRDIDMSCLNGIRGE
jgi:hypothetical protein